MKRGFAFLVVLAIALTLGLGFATLAATLADFAWPLELFVHFRPQLAGLSAAALLLALLLRHRVLTLVAVVLLAANTVPIFPHLMTHLRGTATASAGPNASGTNLRLMFYNMHGTSTNAEGFVWLARHENPDVILLTEMPSDIDLRMAPLVEAYPHRVLSRHDSFHEVGIFSRWPIAGIATDRSAHIDLPVVAADLCPPSETAGGCVRVVGLHAVAPFGANAALRERQLAGAARAAATHLGPTVVVGDLNTAPWAPAFKRLTERGRLVDTSPLRGLHPTWWPWRSRSATITQLSPLLALSIDHVLISEDIAARAVRVGPNTGSDHRPIVADLTLPALAP